MRRRCYQPGTGNLLKTEDRATEELHLANRTSGCPKLTLCARCPMCFLAAWGAPSGGLFEGFSIRLSPGLANDAPLRDGS